MGDPFEEKFDDCGFFEEMEEAAKNLETSVVSLSDTLINLGSVANDVTVIAKDFHVFIEEWELYAIKMQNQRNWKYFATAAAIMTPIMWWFLHL